MLAYFCVTAMAAVRDGTSSTGLFWRATGDLAKPVLFMNPGGGGIPFPDDWGEAVDDSFLVVTYDPCGVGRATCSARDSFDAVIDDAHALLLEVAQALGTAASYYVGGFSGGCFTAAELARRQPNATRGLLLVSPLPDFAKARDVASECIRRRVNLAAFVPWLVRNEWSYVALSQNVCGSYCTQTSSLLRAAVACRAPWVVAPAVVVAGILQRIRLGETYKSRTLSLPMPVPTHVFLGSWDQVAPPHLVDEWLRAHDASSVVSVTRFTRSAHFIRYEEPEAFRAAARKILVSG